MSLTAANHFATQRGKTMNRRLIHTMLAAASALAPLALLAPAPAAAQSVQRPASEIVLSIGRGQLVTVPGAMADIFISRDEVADVQIKSQRQLYIFGKAGGETTVYASDAGGNVIWSANVRVGSNIDTVDQMLALAMPDAKVAVSTMGTNTYLLTGTVASPDDAAEVQRLVKAYVGDGANVISRLRTATPLTVNLQVRFAEVSRSFVKSLNGSMTTIDGTGGFKFGVGSGRDPGTFVVDSRTNLPFGVGRSVTTKVPDPSVQWVLNSQGIAINPETGAPVKLVDVAGTALNQVTGLNTIGGMGKLFGLNVLGALDAGETVGLVSTLAQPNLTALSGETAEFLAGGEYPIPISQGLGATSIEYKKYGVSLAYTPFVLANGRISLRVRPEVSELSSQGAVNFDGFQIPALTIRRTETTVELGSGQSFMIAGLMSNNAQNTIQKMPGAGDLPILGSLFRSTSFRKGETELVIVITPYLVKPVDAADIKLPTDGYRAPNELQRILGNIEQDGVTGGDRPKPRAAEPAAPNPAVGMTEPAALPAPISGSEADRRKKRKAKRTTQASAPTPGFNLD